MVNLCNPHAIKFIISQASIIQIFIYYLLEMLLITFIAISVYNFFMIKFIIALTFSQKTKAILIFNIYIL